HQQHVRGLDALPAGDRGAVEGVAFLEFRLVEVLHRHADVLLLAARIGKAEVDELYFLLFDELQYIIRRHRHLVLPKPGWLISCSCGGPAFQHVPCQTAVPVAGAFYSSGAHRIGAETLSLHNERASWTTS